MRGPGKGKTNNPNGRPKGSLNKSTASATEAFDLAFQGLGGWKRLQTWAEDNYGDFIKIFGKRIKQEVELTGPDGGPIKAKVEVTFAGTSVEHKG